MFNKLVDLLKEVFWLKPSRKKRQATSRKTAKKKIPKKAVKKSIKKTVQPKAQPKSKIIVKQPKALGKKPAKPQEPVIDPGLSQVGEITHYFDRIKVCVVKLTQGTILIGDKLTIIGPKTKFVQKVWSMQIESSDVKVAKKGQLAGLKVDKLVAVGDKVFK